MVTLNHVKNGVSKYMDAEIMSRIDGLNKWFMGVLMVSLPKTIETKYSEYKSMLKDLGVVNETDEIDIDRAEEMLIESATKYGKASMSLGNVRVNLGCDDIRKVSAYIRQ